MTSAGKRIGVVQTGVICVAAYLIGVALSPYLLPVDFLSSKLVPLLHRQDASMTAEPPTATSAASQPTALPGNPPTWSPHEAAYKSIVDFEGRNDPFYQVDIVVHRNGESDPCSRQQRSAPDGKEIDDTNALSSTSRSFLNSINALGNKSLDQYQKYDVDAILTHTLAGVGGDTSGTHSFLLENGNSCGPTWTTKNHYLDESPQSTNNEVLSSMIKFCDMGVDKTPIQLDHHKMVRVPKVGSLPCHFHTREGVRITSLGQLAQFAREAKVPDGECTEKERTVDGNSSCGTAEAGGEGGKSSVGRRELHLYAVQAGRMFVFAPKYVGEIFELPHVEVPLGLPVWLEVISLSPRVFDIFNFFDREESAAIVDKALKETSETHRMKRSSTGASGYTVNSQRTSENGFDTHGTQAQAVKHRCLNVLGTCLLHAMARFLQVLYYASV
jgi:hypothetical protein